MRRSEERKREIRYAFSTFSCRLIYERCRQVSKKRHQEYEMQRVTHLNELEVGVVLVGSHCWCVEALCMFLRLGDEQACRMQLSGFNLHLKRCW